MPYTPRQVALSLLANWTVAEDPPHIPERGDPHWAHLAARDRNFAFDLVTGVIRHRGTLDVVLGSQLKMPLGSLEPKVHAVLWLGSYELLLRENAKPYACVHEAVELAKASGIGRSAGLVNAVLRAITRLQPRVRARGGLTRHAFPRDFAHEVAFATPLFPAVSDLPAHLAAVTSHPVELVRMMIGAHGAGVATDILIRNNLRPVIVLRVDDPGFVPPAEAGLTAHETPGFFVASEGWNAELEGLVARGVVSPQDPTSAKVVQRLAGVVAEEGAKVEHVVDLCAGLGTKTIQMARAFSASPGVRITATDIDATKLAALAQRAGALGLGNVRTVPLAGLAAGGGGAADVVLIDAPCSNTGVMGRRVQSRWRWPRLELAGLQETQVGLLRQAAGLTAAGGLIAYATCSIDPAENRAIIDRFLAGAGRPAVVVREELTLPAACDAAGRQHDGGYLAIMRVS